MLPIAWVGEEKKIGPQNTAMSESGAIPVILVKLSCECQVFHNPLSLSLRHLINTEKDESVCKRLQQATM